jgi:hypothetical protein
MMKDLSVCADKLHVAAVIQIKTKAKPASFLMENANLTLPTISSLSWYWSS